MQYLATRHNAANILLLKRFIAVNRTITVLVLASINKNRIQYYVCVFVFLGSILWRTLEHDERKR